MEIIAAILGSLVAVFIGAWINNVFTWKIKDKIKSLDRMAQSISAIYYITMTTDKPEDMQDFFANLGVIKLAANIENNKLKAMVENKLLVVMEEWANAIVNSNAVNKDKLKQCAKSVQDELNRIDICVGETREKITSFCYMLKTLFCNWQFLVFVLLGIIVGLLLYCYSSSTVTSVVV